MMVKLTAQATALFISMSLAAAQLPYNPNRLILSSDKSKVYQISSQGSMSYFDIWRQITSSSVPNTIDQALPFQTDGNSLIPVADDEGITVFTGDCQNTSKGPDLWRFTINKDGKNGTWTNLSLSASDSSLTADYLSAGFLFSANGTSEGSSLYIFGGMCPTGPSNITSWTAQATYSNTMLSVSANTNSPSQLSMTGARAPPIAEAGLTITPLSLTATKSSSGQVSQQQNFVLLGGHTQYAFINMSQVALFSLPEASWSFISVDQPTSAGGELMRRDTIAVEPRSGHTAVLTEDGSKIIVFGGWVGNVTSPATPQLAVLQLGQGYGGTENWEWTIPEQTDNPYHAGQGLYGHGVVMLPGNIMMISGGTNIGSSIQKRSAQTNMFYDINTGAWGQTYKSTLPSGSSGLNSSQKAGLGAGLGLGVTALAVVAMVWWVYRRKQRERRAEREKYLRELAFGSERHQSTSRVPSRLDGHYGSSEMRSASWGSRQEQQIEHNNFTFPWSGHHPSSDERDVQRTGMEVPSPTRGLRKSLSARGPAAYGNSFQPPVTGPGSVFRIDEVEEEGSIRSLPNRATAGSRLSDPFKDPPNIEGSSAADERRREVQGWVEDWQSAAVSMNLSRNPSHARTYSNLSHEHSNSESASFRTGRESPEKSDRTGSNLSDRSQISIQKSIGNVSRQMSQRSVSAGYALFSSAAAAMSRLSGANRETELERTASRRSISLNTGPPRRTTSGSHRPAGGESKAFLGEHSPTKSIGDDSPIKDYKNYSRTASLTSQRKKTIMGSVKRVFTGTSQVDVQTQVEHYEEKAEEADTALRVEPEMSETTSGPAFWRGKRGAKDWDENDHHPPSAPHDQNRRSTLDGNSIADYDGDEWDIETAVQKRVVQVMFTVPKERLRVVNADALSLISRSDIDEREERERKAELKRMDSLKEDEDRDGSEDVKGKGRAKKRIP